MGFYMNHKKEAKSLTFGRGSEVSQVMTSTSVLEKASEFNFRVSALRVLRSTSGLGFCPPPRKKQMNGGANRHEVVSGKQHVVSGKYPETPKPLN